MAPQEKLKLALYWAASCGGCEVALANLHERFLELTQQLELFFCPAFVDTKTPEVRALPDGALALTLFNGALRTEENLEMARLLRRKSRTLVAFGACAQSGGIPALSNLSSRAAHLGTVFGEQPAERVPRQEAVVPEGVLRLPRFRERVQRLEAVVEVDYAVPGCPPEPGRLWAALKPFLSGEPLPPRGAVLGGGAPTVCDECTRERQEKRLSGFCRVHQLLADPARCLLDQGVPCAGLGTRGGCGALCPAANMPCSGCYGAPEGVYDQPSKLVSAFGSLLELGGLRGRDEAEVEEGVGRAVDTLPDVAGTVGRYGLGERAARRGHGR